MTGPIQEAAETGRCGGGSVEVAGKSIRKQPQDENEHGEYHPPTSYLETIVHLFKGNIGPGLFAMGDAFKNGGLIVAPLLTVVIAVVSIHCQHVLIACSKKMRDLRGDAVCADYAQTVEQCFENGPMKLRGWSRTMGRLVDIFHLCDTAGLLLHLLCVHQHECEAGSVGYMKWGEEVGGSLTLNLGDTILAQAVKLMVSTGVLLGYPLQFFVAIQIMWPNAKQLCGISGRSLVGELSFRTIMVIVTLAIAEMVPALGLFISLIGALCSTALALVFPPVIELIASSEPNKGPGLFVCTKNLIILVVALLGFFTGSYESLKQIVNHFGEMNG
ncbi:GL18277 [Drosophila persimilis]|uniref:GL18277 n=1 Tax=Drosophila persimilis TaxID=7234 RepID=B4H4N5_DROPE|nr:GL18277 [Drosophila persimilis]